MKRIGKPTVKYNDSAVSSVLGAVLMVFLTFVLAAATFAAIHDNSSIGHMLSKTSIVFIEIKYIVGGIQSEPSTIRFDQNYITLIHKGGDSLDTSSTNVILSGYGSGYVGAVGGGGGGGHLEYGDVMVKYTNLAYDGKVPEYSSTNPALDGGLWSTGEKLILWGEDSINGTDASTVLVSVNGISNTSNNYGFKSGTIVTIKIVDKTTQRIIMEGREVVKPAE